MNQTPRIRTGVLTSALAAALVLLACGGRVAARGEGQEATLIGLLNTIYGDPPPGGAQGMFQAWVTDSSGRSVRLVLSGPDSALVDLRRFHGARVRVSGRFGDEGRTTLIVSRIDSVAGTP